LQITSRADRRRDREHFPGRAGKCGLQELAVENAGEIVNKPRVPTGKVSNLLALVQFG